MAPAFRRGRKEIHGVLFAAIFAKKNSHTCVHGERPCRPAPHTHPKKRENRMLMLDVYINSGIGIVGVFFSMYLTIYFGDFLHMYGPSGRSGRKVTHELLVLLVSSRRLLTDPRRVFLSPLYHTLLLSWNFHFHLHRDLSHFVRGAQFIRLLTFVVSFRIVSYYWPRSGQMDRGHESRALSTRESNLYTF